MPFGGYRDIELEIMLIYIFEGIDVASNKFCVMVLYRMLFDMKTKRLVHYLFSLFASEKNLFKEKQQLSLDSTLRAQLFHPIDNSTRNQTQRICHRIKTLLVSLIVH